MSQQELTIESMLGGPALDLEQARVVQGLIRDSEGDFRSIDDNLVDSVVYDLAKLIAGDAQISQMPTELYFPTKRFFLAPGIITPLHLRANQVLDERADNTSLVVAEAVGIFQSAVTEVLYEGAGVET